MKYLVVGGAGFLGTRLIEFLRHNAESKVTVYDKFMYTNRTVLPTSVSIIEQDLVDFNLEETYDYIYYLAQPRLHDVVDDSQIEQELENLKRVLNYASEHNTGFLFASSCSVYGSAGETVDETSPTQVTSMYSKMKIESEKVIEAYENPKFKIVRLSTLYGNLTVHRPDLMINDFILGIHNNKNFEIFDPEATRPHLYVEDAALILSMLPNTEYEDKVMNIGLNQFNINKRAIANIIKRRLNPHCTIIEHKTQDSRSYNVSFDKMQHLLNFNPTSLEYALQQTESILKRITCSVESYDNLIKYYLPNTASKSWYGAEEGQFSLPKQWGAWNIMDENHNMFPLNVIQSLVSPPNFKPGDITYKTAEELNGEKHLYVIHVFNGMYFTNNQNIGLNCVDERYLEDLRKGNAKLVFICTLEGYSGEEGNNDFEFIEEWIQNQGIAGENVYYITGNLIGDKRVEEKGLSFNAVPLCMFDSWMALHEIDTSAPMPFEPLDEKYLYLSYARNPRKQRIALCANLLEKDLLKKGRVSLGEFTAAPDMYDVTSPETLEKLAALTPLEIDRTLKYNLATDLTVQDYKHTFLSIINETLTSQGTLFLSEKIFKPIILRHPFLVVGNQGTLSYLRSLGFKTFSKWFDESYDNEPDFLKRVEMIVEEVNKLQYRRISELQQMREEMNAVTLFNQKLLLSILNKKYILSKNGQHLEDSYKPIRDALYEIWKTL